jgi:hypothetical protein
MIVLFYVIYDRQSFFRHHFSALCHPSQYCAVQFPAYPEELQSTFNDAPLLNQPELGASHRFVAKLSRVLI